MGRWLDALRQEDKKAEKLHPRPDGTDKTKRDDVSSVLSVPQRPISTNFFSTRMDDGSIPIAAGRGDNEALLLWTEATKRKPGEGQPRDPHNGMMLPKFDNVQDRELAAPTGNSAEAGLRRLQKEAASEDATPISQEKNTESATTVTDKTDKTSSGGFVSRPSPHFDDFFRCDPGGTWNESDWQDAFEERAAILEYDGGWHRDAAEALARQWIDEQKAQRSQIQ